MSITFSRMSGATVIMAAAVVPVALAADRAETARAAAVAGAFALALAVLAHLYRTAQVAEAAALAADMAAINRASLDEVRTVAEVAAILEIEGEGVAQADEQRREDIEARAQGWTLVSCVYCGADWYDADPETRACQTHDSYVRNHGL